MKPTRRVLYALLIAVASGLGACEQSGGLGDLTGPVAQPQFTYEMTTDAAGSKRKVEFIGRTNALTGDMIYTTTQPIERRGGVFTFAGHRLVVPKDAVSEGTYFSATLRAGSEIKLDMRAWDAKGEVTTFARPVELTIDLSDANVSDLSAVSVFYLNPNGAVEMVRSAVNHKTRSVTGFLDHFSDYIPGTLREGPPPPPTSGPELL